MRLLFILAGILILTSFKESSQGEDPQGEWIQLFDGKTTKGWHSYGKKAAGDAWNVQDNALHLIQGEKDNYQTRNGGDLVTNDAFDNFELKLDWKISKNGNSGIIFYVKDDPEAYKETWQTGIETQVLDISGNEDSKSFKHDVADLYDLVPSSSNAAKPFGEWNRVRIKSKNGNLEIWLNDVRVIATTLWDDHWRELVKSSKFKDMPGFGIFKEGHIALQDHGAEVWYKNIVIRKL